MYNRNLPKRKGLREEFISGVDQFINFALSNEECQKNGESVRCPCSKCRNRRFEHPNTVVEHLYRRGFVDDYWIWTCHGEDHPPVYQEENSFPADQQTREGNFNHMYDWGDYQHMRWDQRLTYDCLYPSMAARNLS